VRRLLVLLGAVLFSSLPLFAQQLPPASPATQSGNIVVSGADTLSTLTTNIVTLYTLEGFSGSVVVTPAPTADAFTGLCTGTVDVVLATRLISTDERNACTNNVYTPLEFRVGADALVIAISPQNAFLNDLTTAELQVAFSSAINWSDVRPDYPPLAINRYLPSVETSDFQFFISAVFGGDQSRVLSATNTTSSADSNTLLQALTVDPNGVAILSASVANRNSTLIRTVRLDGVQADTPSVSGGTYTLSRPLVLYSATEIFQEKPQVADFVNYFLSNVNSEVTPIGLYPASAQSQQQAQATWLNATGATVATTTQPLPATTETPTEEPIGEGGGDSGEEVIDDTTDPTALLATGEEQTLLLLIDARADLELMAANTLGVARPPGWSGSLDTTDPQLALLVRLDLETLAGALTDPNTRPVGWFGAVPSTSYSIARDIRHDMELLADEVFGLDDRPDGWAGGEPILRCDRSTQALAQLLTRGGVFQINVDINSPTFCAELASQASVFTEVNLLTTPGNENIFVPRVEVGPAGAIVVNTSFAVAFLDRNAALRVGVIPEGTAVTVVARSPSRFSNMLLVQGPDFLVFTEFINTTLAEDAFRDLPSEDDIAAEPFCNAEWCN
jgi:phosphate transport system substrate-binding protein